MGYWSVYIARDEEKLLKHRIEAIAKKNRWSFSQAITGLLREHLLEERGRISDEVAWEMLSTEAFFEGYSGKDSIYDSL